MTREELVELGIPEGIVETLVELDEEKQKETLKQLARAFGFTLKERSSSIPEWATVFGDILAEYAQKVYAQALDVDVEDVKDEDKGKAHVRLAIALKDKGNPFNAKDHAIGLQMVFDGLHVVSTVTKTWALGVRKGKGKYSVKTEDGWQTFDNPVRALHEFGKPVKTVTPFKQALKIGKDSQAFKVEGLETGKDKNK